MERLSRLGAYGVLVKKGALLLVRKKSGPYKGLWDLPGGGIEFGETPEEALTRELLEESALVLSRFQLIDVMTATGVYENQGAAYHFHHIGAVYKVESWQEISGRKAEEENRWVNLKEISFSQLTPFAKKAASLY